MYGSSFCSVTLNPRLRSRRPRLAVVIPLPILLTTPPVTKIYFVIPASPSRLHDFSPMLRLPRSFLLQNLELDSVLRQDGQEPVFNDIHLVRKRLQLAAAVLHQEQDDARRIPGQHADTRLPLLLLLILWHQAPPSHVATAQTRTGATRVVSRCAQPYYNPYARLWQPLTLLYETVSSAAFGGSHRRLRRVCLRQRQTRIVLLNFLRRPFPGLAIHGTVGYLHGSPGNIGDAAFVQTNVIDGRCSHITIPRPQYITKQPPHQPPRTRQLQKAVRSSVTSKQSL